MLMQNFGVTNKQYYVMLWCFLEWSILYGYTDFSLPSLVNALSPEEILE